MDFQPNEEQRMLAESARRFLSNEFPLAKLREIELQGLAAFLPLYREMGRLGYLGLAIPEEAGGGGDWLDLALFAEEAGRALVPPLQLASLVLGAQALVALGRPERVPALVSGEHVLCPAWLEDADLSRDGPGKTRASRNGDRVQLEGEKRFVQGFEVADELLVAASGDDAVACFVLLSRRTPGVAATPARLTSLDITHDLRFSGAGAAAQDMIAADWKIWLDVIDGAKIIAAAWAVGAARAALDMALAYSRDRKQFGRPIGGFQSVQHRLADAAIALEQATAMVRYAAWLRAAHGPCTAEAAMAKLVAGRAVRQVTHAATLTHGGYGFMEEFDIQLYFRRATYLDMLVEGPVMQREILAAESGDDLLRIH